MCFCIILVCSFLCLQKSITITENYIPTDPHDSSDPQN